MAQTTSVSVLSRLAQLASFLFRFAVLLLIWWLLSGSQEDWWFGAPLAFAAAAASLWLTPPARYRIRPWHFPAFALFFLWHSLLAGWDVGKRTLTIGPRLPLHPAIVELPLRLPRGAPTWWLMLTISLLPGTLSVRLHGRQRLEVHCLDDRQDVIGSIRDTEQRLARLFGLTLTEPQP